MNLHVILPILFIATAGLHFIQWPLFGLNKKTIPILVFGAVYLVLGILWINPVSHFIQWFSLIISMAGFVGLITQLKSFTHSKWVAYSIGVLDFLIILLLSNLLVLPLVLSLFGH